MEIFISEFVHFVAVIFSATVTCATMVFFLVNGYRRKEPYMYAYGFAAMFLTGGLLTFLIGRLIPSLNHLAALFEALGIFLLFGSTFLNPEISCVAIPANMRRCPPLTLHCRLTIALFTLCAPLLLAAAFVHHFSSTSESQAIYLWVALVFAVLNLLTSVTHFRNKHRGKCFKRATLLACGFALLLLREIAILVATLPQTSSPTIAWLNTPYGAMEYAVDLVTLATFVVLGTWSFEFIRHTTHVKRFVNILLRSVTVAAAGSLLFTALISHTMQNENMSLVTHAVESEVFLVQEQANTAMYIARLAGTNAALLEAVSVSDYASALGIAQRFAEQTALSHLRIFTKYGEIFVSATDQRETHQLANNDPLLAYALVNKSQVQSFDTENGVLAPQLIARALYPLILNGELLGAVETVYTFDNARADYLKSINHLDTTFFSGAQRSATTLTGTDGVSRWIGSYETDPDVIGDVLEQGKPLAKMTAFLGTRYFSSYAPIRHLDGSIIGMVSVSDPATNVFETARIKLVTGFLIAAITSFVAALLAVGWTASRKRWAAESR